MKKTLPYIIITFIFLFISFFYSKKVISLVNKNAPLMNEIRNYSNNYFIEPIDAVINSDEVITGFNGCKIDVNKSYGKMNNIFNINLLEYKQVKPKVSSINIYDKYIVRANNTKNNVSLLFIIKENSDVKRVINILNNNYVKGTFFIEDNSKKVINIIRSGQNEVYNYDYRKDVLKRNDDFYKYCLLKEKNENVLGLCKNNLSKTLIPNIYLEKNYLISVKKSIVNGSIICFTVTNTLIKELDEIVKYIKTKGYTILKLDNLLNESRNCY